MNGFLFFVLGWFGKYWWPGIEVDAPRPGGGDPWWNLVIGAASGVITMVVMGGIANSNPMPGIASADPMPGLVAAIAVGCIAGRTLTALSGLMRSK